MMLKRLLYWLWRVLATLWRRDGNTRVPTEIK